MTTSAIMGTIVNWWANTFDKPDSYVALFTGLLFVSTVMLWLSTRGLFKVTKQTVKLAREEFVASHRPRIRVRFVQGPWDETDGHKVAHITLVNTGETQATIYESGCDLARREIPERGGGWLPPGLTASPQPIDPIRLDSGQRLTITVRTKKPDGEAELFGYAVGNHELCIVGAIKYRDDNGISRETAFFRIDRQMGGSLRTSENPEDEYED